MHNSLEKRFVQLRGISGLGILDRNINSDFFYNDPRRIQSIKNQCLAIAFGRFAGKIGSRRRFSISGKKLPYSAKYRKINFGWNQTGGDNDSQRKQKHRQNDFEVS